MTAKAAYSADAVLSDRINDYLARAWRDIPGWVDASVVHALHAVAQYHNEFRIVGDALEIGVFHGRFFLALMAAIKPDEKAVALDVFDNQALNIDHSAGDTRLETIFRENVKSFADNQNSAVVLSGDSLITRARDLLKLSDGFRLISVDGGHTPEHVMNDMGLAAEVVVNGGVVMVDDWMSPHWPGVHEGYLRFMTTRNHTLAPVLYTGNKLFMTTISHHCAVTGVLRQKFTAAQDIRPVRSCGFDFLSAL